MNLRPLGKSVAYAIRRLLPRKDGAIILAYHSIDDTDDPYTVSPGMFEWQLGEIRRQGLRVVKLAELEKMLEAGHVESRTVVLTFDDGRRDNYVHTFPILKRFAMPATIFSVTGIIGSGFKGSSGEVPVLTEAQMRDMHDSGLVDFEPHTESHPNLKKIPIDDVRREVTTSKRMLENMLGRPCPYFAYPYGRHTQEIRRVVRESGIRLAVATHAGFVTLGSERLALPRNDIRPDVTPAQFKSILRRGSLR